MKLGIMQSESTKRIKEERRTGARINLKPCMRAEIVSTQPTTDKITIERQNSGNVEAYNEYYRNACATIGGISTNFMGTR